tara:strand:+ start:103 stop:564 length:462 start_codon:yes stop_codon:yes gene_type:complete
MKLISHRGNIRGPIPDKENRPSYIDCAIGNGYDVEIDVNYVNGELWLGHDEPQYKVTHTWIQERSQYLWLHCKDFESAKECWKYQAFCHSGDPFVFTSNNKIWLHGENESIYTLDDMTIIPVINKQESISFNTANGVPFGVCTDYPAILKDYE